MHTDTFKVKKIHDSKHYEVWVVKMPDLPSETYGVISKEHNVIESLQPILYNAKKVSEEFSKWIDGDDAMASMEALNLGLN